MAKKDQEKAQGQAKETKAQAEEHAQGKADDETRAAQEADEAARAEREADAREQERARSESGGEEVGPPRLREASQAFSEAPPTPSPEQQTAPDPGRSQGPDTGPRSVGLDLGDFTEAEKNQALAYVKLIRSRRGGAEPVPGGIDPALPTPGGPPRLTDDEIRLGHADAARAPRGDVRGPQGETNPGDIPTLMKEQGDPSRAARGATASEGEQPPQNDPERVPTEGEIMANVALLHSRGDLSPMHPMYRKEAMQTAGGRSLGRADDGGERPRTFRVVSGQVGPIASPERGGPRRSYTLEEMGIPKASIDRLMQKGVIVEDDPR